MREHVCCSVLFAGLIIGLTGCMSDTGSKPVVGIDGKELQVVDLAIISTNQVVVGTNTLSLTAATQYLAANSEELDAAVLHGKPGGAGSVRLDPDVLSRLMSADVPVILVDSSEEKPWRSESRDSHVRTLKLSTDQFRTFERLWSKGRDKNVKSAGAAVNTTLLWDTDSGDYELYRMELGILGRRVWVMYQESDEAAEDGTVGIHLKKEF